MDTSQKRSREFLLNGSKTMWHLPGEVFARQVSKARKGNGITIAGVYIDLTGVDLRRGVFLRKILQYVTFQGCVIIGADLEEFTISRCIFKSCVFIDPNFRRAKISNSWFFDVDFIGVEVGLGERPHSLGSFDQAKLFRCIFDKSRFESLHVRVMSVSSTEMNLCDFTGSRLGYFELSGARIDSCDFTDTGVSLSFAPGGAEIVRCSGFVDGQLSSMTCKLDG